MADEQTQTKTQLTPSTLGVTSASFTALGPALAADIAEVAQQLRYESYWTAEANGTESFVLLTACGARAPQLDLGTGIVPIQVRSPLLAAMSAATLQALHPKRRIFLGVGASTPTITERWHGVPYVIGSASNATVGGSPKGALAQMRSYLVLLRSLLAGETVTGDDGFWNLRGASLGVRLAEQRPQLVLAALNPGMLRLAGELADGVLLNYLPAAHVGASVAEVHAGEAAAGRPVGACAVYGYVHVGVADREAARERGRRDVFGYAAAEGYGNMMARAGFGEEVSALRKARAGGDRAGALAAVSDRMVDAIDLVGTEAEVRDFVASYVAEGITHPIVMPLPWGPDRRATIEATLAAVADR